MLDKASSCSDKKLTTVLTVVHYREQLHHINWLSHLAIWFGLEVYTLRILEKKMLLAGFVVINRVSTHTQSVWCVLPNLSVRIRLLATDEKNPS